MESARQLQSIVATSPLLRPILQNWERVALTDGWLVAGGSIAQTVWNRLFNLPAAHGIADIDIVYFDPADLSEEAEAQHAARIRDVFSDLPVRIDVKNEARVHLWYEAKFGYRISPYKSAPDAIDTFPTTATAVGVQPTARELGLYAPFGLSDLLNGIVRPNKRQITREVYDAKAARWRATWPGLTIIDWDDDRGAASSRSTT
jgi:hypothetical protein